MPQDTKRFKVGEKIYNIPLDKADAFISANQDAQEVAGFQVGEKKYNIPLDKVDAFREQFGDQATPIGVTMQQPEVVADTVETVRNPLESIQMSAWNAMRYQLPQTALMTDAATKEIVAERAEIGMNLGFAARLGGSPLSGAVGMAMDDPSTKEEVEKFTDYIRKEVKPRLYTAAIKFQDEGAEYTKGLISSLDKAEDWLDYVNWAGYAFGQAVGQMPASIVTGGATAFLLETGEIYQAGVEKIAEERGITVQEVLEQGLDEPAVAIAFGVSAAALETMSGAKIITAPMKNAARNSLRARLASIAESGLLEFSTEGAQSVVEQVGSNIMAGKDWKDIDYKDVYESAMAGLAGGSGISMSSHAVQSALNKKDGKDALAKKLTETTGEKHIVTMDDRIWNADKKRQIKTLDDIRKSEDEDYEINEATSTGDASRDAIISELVDNTIDRLEDSEFIPKYTYKGEEIDRESALLKIAQGDVKFLQSINDDATQKLINIALKSKQAEKKPVAKVAEPEVVVEKPVVAETPAKPKEVKPKFPAEEKATEETDMNTFLSKAVRDIKKQNVNLFTTISVGEEQHTFSVDTQEDGTQTYSKTVTKQDGTTAETIYAHLGELRNGLYESRKIVKEQEKAAKPAKVKAVKEVEKLTPFQKWVTKLREGRVEDTQHNYQKAITALQKKEVDDADIEVVNKFVDESVYKPEETAVAETGISDDLSDVEVRLTRADNMLKAGNNPDQIQEQLDIASEELEANKKAAGYDKLKSKLDEYKEKNQEAIREVAKEEGGIKEEPEVERLGGEVSGEIAAEPTEPTKAERDAISRERDFRESRIALKALNNQLAPTDVDEYLSWRDEVGLPKMKSDSEKRLRNLGSKSAIGKRSMTALRAESARLETTAYDKRKKMVSLLKSQFGLFQTEAEQLTNEFLGEKVKRIKVTKVEKPKLEKVEKQRKEPAKVEEKARVPEAEKAKPVKKPRITTSKIKEAGYKVSAAEIFGDINVVVWKTDKGEFAVSYNDDVVSSGVSEQEANAIAMAQASKAVDERMQQILDEKKSKMPKISGDRAEIVKSIRNNRMLRFADEKMAEAKKRNLVRAGKSNLLVSKDYEILSAEAIGELLKDKGIPIENFEKLESLWDKSGIGRLKVYVADDIAMINTKEKAIDAYSVYGVYDPVSNTIAILRDRIKGKNNTLLHEFIHRFETAFYHSALHVPIDVAQFITDNGAKPLRPSVEYRDKIHRLAGTLRKKLEVVITKWYNGKLENADLRNAIDKYFETERGADALEYFVNRVNRKITPDITKVFYGSTNGNELVAETFSSPTFANILMNLDKTGDVSVTPKNIAESFLFRIMTIIGDAIRTISGKTINLVDTFLGDVVNLAVSAEEVFMGDVSKLASSLSEVYSEAGRGREISINFDKKLNDDHNKIAKKIRINKYDSEKAARVKFVMHKFRIVSGSDMTLDELKSLVRRVNSKVPNNKKISGNDMLHGYKNYHNYKQRVRNYNLQKGLQELDRQLRIGEIGVVKEKIVDFIKSNIKKTVDRVQTKELNRILEVIRDSNDLKQLKQYINNARHIVRDINNSEIIRKFNIAKKRINVGNSKFDVSDSAAWNIIKGAKDEVFDDNTFYMMEELPELLRDPIGNRQELMNWSAKYVIESDKYNAYQEEILEAMSDESIAETDVKKEKSKQRKRAKEIEIKLNIWRAAKYIDDNLASFMEGRDYTITGDILKLIKIGLNINAYTQGAYIPPAGIKAREIFLSDSEMKAVADALYNLRVNNIVSSKVGNIIAKASSIDRLAFIRDRINPDKLTRLGRSWLGQKLNTLRSTPMLLLEAAKWSEKDANILNNAIFAEYRKESANALDRSRRIAIETRKIIDKNKLNLNDFITISHFANIMTTKGVRDNSDKYIKEINDNINYYERSINNKLIDANSGEYKGQNVKEIRNEIDLFNKVKAMFLDDKVDNENILTKEQKELYKYMRNMLDDIAPAVKHSANVNLNKPFSTLNDFFPLQGVGRIDKGRHEQLMTGLQVENILSDIVNDKTGLKKIENFHLRERVGSKKVYYNNNAFAVFEEYVSGILFDIHTARHIQTMHYLLSSNAFKDMVGGNNASLFYDRARNSVKVSRRKHTQYSKLVRFLEELRTNVLVSQVANIGQFAKQLVSMFGAFATMNPKGLVKTAKILSTKSPDEINEWFHEHGAGIQRRDVFMERIGTPTSYISEVYKLSEKAENITSFALRKTDALSARISFLNAFFEKGGSWENPDNIIIAEAELLTDIVQNVSDPSFAGTAWTPDSDTGRAWMSLAYHLKHFAANYTLGFLGAAARAGSSGLARRYVIQAVIGSIIFQMLTDELRRQTMRLFGVEDDDDRAYWRKMLDAAIAGTADLTTAHLPAVADYLAKNAMNGFMNAIGYEGNDNLFYTESELRGGTGGYAPIYDVFNEASTFINDATEGDFSNVDTHDAAWIAAQVMSFFRIVPFRGDLRRGMLRYWRAQEIKKKEEQKLRNRMKNAVGGGKSMPKLRPLNK